MGIIRLDRPLNWYSLYRTVAWWDYVLSSVVSLVGGVRQGGVL